MCYPILGYFSGRGEWNAAFAVGTGFCIVAGALWLLVRADERFAPSQSTLDASSQRELAGVSV